MGDARKDIPRRLSCWHRKSKLTPVAKGTFCLTVLGLGGFMLPTICCACGGSLGAKASADNENICCDCAAEALELQVHGDDIPTLILEPCDEEDVRRVENSPLNRPNTPAPPVVS
jgi:hypothetical protein